MIKYQYYIIGIILIIIGILYFRLNNLFNENIIETLIGFIFVLFGLISILFFIKINKLNNNDKYELLDISKINKDINYHHLLIIPK